ncbi:MAG: hypothetical protein LBS22_02005 [Puniceicoccales bacterium]|jgi:hypothetical protein|nr:hypothetical protein [Puniceicoccales bacterium]
MNEVSKASASRGNGGVPDSAPQPKPKPHRPIQQHLEHPDIKGDILDKRTQERAINERCVAAPEPRPIPPAPEPQPQPIPSATPTPNTVREAWQPILREIRSIDPNVGVAIIQDIYAEFKRMWEEGPAAQAQAKEVALATIRTMQEKILQQGQEEAERKQAWRRIVNDIRQTARGLDPAQLRIVQKAARKEFNEIWKIDPKIVPRVVLKAAWMKIREILQPKTAPTQGAMQKARRPVLAEIRREVGSIQRNFPNATTDMGAIQEARGEFERIGEEGPAAQEKLQREQAWQDTQGEARNTAHERLGEIWEVNQEVAIAPDAVRDDIQDGAKQPGQLDWLWG